MKDNLANSAPVSSETKFQSLWICIALTLVSIVLWDTPAAGWLLAPIKTFVTAVHEMGHATACLATGGSVSGLTIVSDNNGHGGLTMCEGGNPFIYTQAGYLGTAIFGCVLIFLGRFRVLAQGLLILMGLAIAFASIFLMPGSIFHQGAIFQGLGSIIWGLIIAAALVWSGAKMNPFWAQLLILFLAVQTSLNSLTDVWYLLQISSGFSPSGSFSDATNMQDMTHIPAVFWSLFWALASIAMLAGTLWICWGGKAGKK